ncbi:MAG: class I SAM-dependent methyltransferase [Bacteroidales bacterium]|nr:class I SAM-dependent methyltransferase [Lachnoclostridium sp.]MCM1383938.1 class I SAM-dependent methyltransferase [Lachnoclostridium sp.]MCM1464647.1 class I SAM-dependent methyltransferase [Bacteroidales bacterium]
MSDNIASENVEYATLEEVHEFQKQVWEMFPQTVQGIVSLFTNIDNIGELWVSGGALLNQLHAFDSYVDLFALSPELHKKYHQLEERCKSAQEMELPQQLALSADFLEMMEELEKLIGDKRKRCNVCGEDVFFVPFPSEFEKMRKKYGFLYWNADFQLESKENWRCPVCKAYDRDRLMIAFLEELQVDADEKLRMLQVAPSPTLEHYASSRDDIFYESTDIEMQNVTFQADLQDLFMVSDETYDIIICSHVLEHVQDDGKAMRELFRILKPEGVCLVLVPLVVGKVDTDEEWGCSEEENWRRFCQFDHCRLYGRKDFMERLQKAGFYVNEIGKSYFGEEFYAQYGFDDNSILYVATKSLILQESEENEKDREIEDLQNENKLMQKALTNLNNYFAEYREVTDKRIFLLEQRIKDLKSIFK